jgi:hypothetical protein
MNDASRTQGWAICIGSAALAFFFLIGILNGSYWALALPVAALTFFALGLAGWVGYTIATIQVEPDTPPEVLSTDAPPAPVASASTPASTSPSSPSSPSSADSSSAGDSV